MGPTPRTVRLVDIAKEAEVSVSVVSSVLNGGRGNTRVGKETAERILAIAERRNYRPSPTAQQLRGKRSNVFGLLVASAGDPLRSYLVEHLDEEAVKHGCQTLIGNTVVAPGRFEGCLDEFLARGVDGIFCAVHSVFPGNRAELLGRCPNTVFYEDPGLPDATFVEIDQVAAGRVAARHLLESGRRRLGFAILDPASASHRDRLRGIREALAERGVDEASLAVSEGAPGCSGPVRPDPRTMLWQIPDEALDGVIEQLVVGHGVDAIVAHDDFLASALLRRLRARGLRVPRDVAVTGYLNHYLCDHVDPPLTSVDLRHHAAARAMVGAVQEMIAGGTAAERLRRPISISPMLVVRESA